MDTKLRGRVDGKMIVGEGDNKMYIFAHTDIEDGKSVNDGDRVVFVAQGVRAIEIEKIEVSPVMMKLNELASKNASKKEQISAKKKKVSPIFTNANNNKKLAGFEFMGDSTDKRTKQKNSLTQNYITNIKKFGISSVILPIICIGLIYFFIQELIEVVKFALSQVNLLSERYVFVAVGAFCFIIVMLSHIVPLNWAFQNFSYASKSTSILKQNINFNLFFVLTFLAVIGCAFFFGFENFANSLEILGGIGLLLLLTYFYKFKMFFKAWKVSGVWLFIVAIFVEFLSVGLLITTEILSIYKDFQIFGLFGIVIANLFFIVSYLMISKIENDSKNIWNVR